jgi:drug/metabolite transporter (DMT)-like permease
MFFGEMFLNQQIFGAIILLIGIYLAGISDKKIRNKDDTKYKNS